MSLEQAIAWARNAGNVATMPAVTPEAAQTMGATPVTPVTARYATPT